MAGMSYQGDVYRGHRIRSPEALKRREGRVAWAKSRGLPEDMRQWKESDVNQLRRDRPELLPRPSAATQAQKGGTFTATVVAGAMRNQQGRAQRPSGTRRYSAAADARSGRSRTFTMTPAMVRALLSAGSIAHDPYADRRR